MKKLILILTTVILIIMSACSADPTPSQTVEGLPTAGPPTASLPTAGPPTASLGSPTAGPTYDPNQTSPSVDKNSFDWNKAFLKREIVGENALVYRIYIPQSYTGDQALPVVFCLGSNNYGTDGNSHMEQTKVLFCDENSPFFDSIVVVPQAPATWNNMEDSLKNLIDTVTSMYNADDERIYLVSSGMGCFAGWKLLVKYPTLISSALFVHGPGVPVGSDGKNIVGVLDEVQDELIDIPLYFVHDTDDTSMDASYSKYSQSIVKALAVEGFTNVTMKETSGHGKDIINHFASKGNIEVLNWLFAQRRITK
ncbi:MAG: hypothetical protein E7312_02810 [Clostridiales bacterium]|nr:hypothetical protein [Clostridiales bacterium]